MHTQQRGWGLELGWIGVFLLLLAAAVWHQDRNAEIGPLAHQDLQHKLQRFPALDKTYQAVAADRRITRSEYRALHRAYRSLEAAPRG